MIPYEEELIVEGIEEENQRDFLRMELENGE
jgi:hypothetical protein